MRYYPKRHDQHPLRHIISKAWSEGMHEPKGKAKELLKICCNYWRFNKHEYYPSTSDNWSEFHNEHIKKPEGYKVPDKMTPHKKVNRTVTITMDEEKDNA